MDSSHCICYVAVSVAAAVVVDGVDGCGGDCGGCGGDCGGGDDDEGDDDEM